MTDKPITLPPTYRVPPKLTYSGLTIIMSHPSRFDKYDLLSANGGYFFTKECLYPVVNRMQCDVRLTSNKEPLIEGTKCVLLLGEQAAREWLGNTENSLNEMRGSVYLINGIPHIASYLPQDATDVTAQHESKFNSYLAENNVTDEFGDEGDEENEQDEKRRHGFTKRKNYRFWLQADTKKALFILRHGIPPRPFEPIYHIYPSASTVLLQLDNCTNQNLFIDIETDPARHILCFSFAVDYGPTYCIPCILHDYQWAYAELPQIFRALALAFQRNTTVAHNGAGFDFFVFATMYRIPVGDKLYDTMLAHHRCFPEVEKSLGHVTSYWTHEPFHKDESNFAYNTPAVCRQLWNYNAKDVYTMQLVHKAINEYAARRPGLTESIQQANDSIKPYLTTSVQGIKMDYDKRDEVMQENDGLMEQYLRLIDLLIGRDFVKALRGKGKSGMPGSNLQCCRYFHDTLGYPIVNYGKQRKDGTKGPSLGKKNMLKLRLKHDNPVIDIVLAYRETSKESGSLKFTPYKVYATNTIEETKELQQVQCVPSDEMLSDDSAFSSVVSDAHQ